MSKEIELSQEEIDALNALSDGKVIGENIEQLDELSKGTLKSYVKKASKSSEKHWAKGDKEEDKAMSTDGNKYPDKQKRHIANASAAQKVAMKRDKGIKVANKKLSEDISEAQWEEMSDDEFNDLVENFEELNELSKKTLGSYVKKASQDIKGHKDVEHIIGNSKDSDYHDHSDYAKKSYRDKIVNNSVKIISKREKGISRAVDKLTKEEEEMKEAIDPSTVKKDKKGISLSKNASDFDKKNKIKEDISEPQVDEAIDPSTVKKDKKGISLSKNATMFDKKNKIKEDTDMNEGEFPLSQASTADNLKPNARPIDQPKSRLEVMKAVVGSLADMDDTSYTAFFNAVWPTIQKVHAGMDNSAANRATLKPANEEFVKLFSDDGLTEEFKEQAKTLFETAVHLEVSMRTAEIQETYEVKLEEEVNSVIEDTEQKLNTYLDFVTDKFIKENELAIESDLKVSRAMEFVDEAKALFSKYNIDINEDEVSQIESLQDKIAGLEEAVNSALNDKINLLEKLNSFTKEKIIDEISEGLADTQKDRLKTLSEAISFDDEETYKAKLTLVKDKFISESTKSTGIELNEKVEIEEDKPKSSMSFYAQNLRK